MGDSVVVETAAVDVPIGMFVMAPPKLLTTVVDVVVVFVVDVADPISVKPMDVVLVDTMLVVDAATSVVNLLIFP